MANTKALKTIAIPSNGKDAVVPLHSSGLLTPSEHIVLPLSVRTIPLTVAVKDRTTLAPLICSAPPEDQVIRLGYCLSQDPLSLGVHCPRCVVFVYASPADGRPTRCLLETTHDEWFDLASDGASLVPVWGDRPIHVRSLVF